MSKAADRRHTFIADCMAPANAAARGEREELTSEEWQQIIDRMATEGPALGRTARWQASCRWAQAITKDSGEPAARWATVQGAIYMSHDAQ